jgi:hypothetical protein
MLVPRNALASGPQVWLGEEKGLLKMKAGKPGLLMDRIGPVA